jgi:hypothetical protein
MLNSLGVRYDADRYAQDTQAALARDQWATYLATFMPVEDQMISYATDPALSGQNAQRAVGMVDQAFDANAGAQERRRRAYGIRLTGDEQQAIDRRNNVEESLTKVHAANTSRDMTLSNQRQLIGAGSGGIV